jgi:ribonuclease Z
MLENAPFREQRFGDLTLQGWSRAGIQSYWRIPEWKLGFDFGAAPTEFIHTPKLFFSHAHLDHMLALPIFLTRRWMFGLEPPEIYVPIEVVRDVKRLLFAWKRLDKGSMKCRIIGLAPGDEVQINQGLILKAIETFHPVPSRGCILYEVRNKLKQEFQALSGEEIRLRKSQGEQLTEAVRYPKFAYTGDTNYRVFDRHPELFEVETLLFELSFLKPASHGRAKIHEFGHIHIDDVIERAEWFRNRNLIGCHVSSRYTREQAEVWLKEAFGAEWLARFTLWM